MKLVHGFALLAISSLATASTWLGCSSTTNIITGNDGGTPPTDSGNNTTDTSTNTGSDTGTESDTGTTPEAGSSDGGIDQTCPAYCTAIMATCTGDNAQYQSTDECLNACAFFPPGTADDTAGNTLGCRIYHATLAGTMGTNPHCWHAGPFGGIGVCGGTCEDFCLLAVGWCGPDAGYTGTPPYATSDDCTMACGGWLFADGGSTQEEAYNASGPDSGDTFDCRAFQLGVALNSASLQAMNCAAVAADSGPCQ